MAAPGTTALAGGMFGPPQTISRQDGGLNTAIGYRYHEDTYTGQSDHLLRQNQVYSQASYGALGIWEVYGRIGIADLKIFDAFSSTSVLTATNKNHFEENWKFFGTLGAKGFYPINGIFGVGAFLQGSGNFSNFTDEIAGVHNGAPFLTDLKVKNIWDVHFGIGAQATLPRGFKLYAGPYVYYAEADVHLSPAVPGIQSGVEKATWRNKSAAGGFFGADIPLAKGFRLNIEGQYTDRFSVGSAITYTY
ncbi:MAG: hypothetical protein K4571_02185 [Deltaproteobacteria bacterium]